MAEEKTLAQLADAQNYDAFESAFTDLIFEKLRSHGGLCAQIEEMNGYKHIITALGGDDETGI